MMKFQTTIAASLATILVVPAVTNGDEIGTLEDALSNTVRALEVLAGIEAKVAQGEEGASNLVTAVTEPPILDPRRRDDRLGALRNEVSLLQTELDLLETSRPPAAPEHRVDPIAASAAAVSDGTPLPPVHTGLNASTLDIVRSVTKPEEERSTTRATTGEGGDSRIEVRTESEGYSADPLGQARACYRAKRYEQGAALLAEVTSDAEALYWRARCLEKLDRLDEASKDLKKVIDLVTDDFQRQRAKTDLEFVEWKKGFLSKLEKRSGGRNG